MTDIIHHYSNSTDSYYIVINGEEYNVTTYIKSMIQRGRVEATNEMVSGIKEILEDNAIYNIDCVNTLAEQIKERKNI